MAEDNATIRKCSVSFSGGQLDMNLIARFKKLTIWNRLAVVGSIASVIGLLVAFQPYLVSVVPSHNSKAESAAGHALSINEMRDSTIIVSNEYSRQHNRTKSQVAEPNVLASASVLAFQTVDEDFGFALKVENIWPNTVRRVLATSSEEFRHALRQDNKIVHLSIGFDARNLWFDENDIISTEQFRDMFIASGTTKLLILDGCGSFAIGKVLEDAGLDYLVVALPDAQAADMFFTHFYQQLERGCAPDDAVAMAKAEVNSHGGNALDFSCTAYN